MAYAKTSTAVGMPSITSTIASTDYIKTVPLGTIIQATDPTYGTGEFIYLEGVASTVVGSIVNYDDSFQTALESTTLSKARPNAVAMSANLASQYGWYQISGIAVVAKANTTSYAKGAGLAAGSGLAIAAASGLQISGAFVAVVASAKSNVTTVNVMVNRPRGPRN
jgi:predicted RecA/RadA family phage recombinase